MRIIRKAFKIILSILIIVTFMLSNNQFSFADPGNIIVTINSDITSGTLQTEVESQAGPDNAAQVKELHITGGGALNNTDIAYINTMINLEVLNVASTVIVGNVGDNFCSSFSDSGNIPDFDSLREVTFPA
ncbi:MAG: hypothetical protein KMY55_08275, partial [Dethiosulfatibacter sp.]|nr:hypothetical protein [Dethiosulfatibacter sp.]